MNSQNFDSLYDDINDMIEIGPKESDMILLENDKGSNDEINKELEISIDCDDSSMEDSFLKKLITFINLT